MINFKNHNCSASHLNGDPSPRVYRERSVFSRHLTKHCHYTYSSVWPHEEMETLLCFEAESGLHFYVDLTLVSFERWPLFSFSLSFPPKGGPLLICVEKKIKTSHALNTLQGAAKWESLRRCTRSDICGIS